MSRLKVLSGEEIIKIFMSYGFDMVSQRGSHVKLKRETEEGVKQTLTIPKHQELDKGTIRAVYRQASRYISEKDLADKFYED
ncbi:hypothetical protein A2833_00680 [Candidatus Azambacteria bacterium RIFCSPHIGHO2_01_FULL_44_55]|uniref:Addiction module toxin, HicA family n=1 Tax=Candidatus Azambacteria bacterium RIFCSPLOWO2_02_FULL_44_14 TaxID=1797306 RepID=A0A1F5CBE4_9BACT|nr:MAG: hypothetical protein A3C78_01610 [Candidatus Azambacteria bacterium RIFCSPHIGHO2_02_FULL_45_18]OGD40148.1 MAG: hypothetical protein A3I30_02665 [Candidatus Azambacteria bacterium RIFCSPLOWO2_02_FULL_44_14]OGD40885.1 MAG: hypothetical protein A2833_00680 [Candidatus Azambacteria bacterium RIFCSPHIGHO2_01_FULL_44_55]OGD49955.1 MAG: hypothetical protein A2608_01070 [Candidatus Azambacteria bacterium RIFOXYD1_FULL_44_10]